MVLVDLFSKTRKIAVQMRSIYPYKLKANKVRASSRPTRIKMIIFETIVKFIDIKLNGKKCAKKTRSLFLASYQEHDLNLKCQQDEKSRAASKVSVEQNSSISYYENTSTL